MFALSNPTKRNPYSTNYYSDIDRVFDAFFDNTRAPSNYSNASVSKNNYAIDENENDYQIRLDIPGIRPESVNITFEKGILELSTNVAPSEKSPEKAEASEEKTERSLNQRFRIPKEVDIEKISAKSDLGELTVTLPKKDAALARKIVVNANG